MHGVRLCIRVSQGCDAPSARAESISQGCDAPSARAESISQGCDAPSVCAMLMNFLNFYYAGTFLYEKMPRFLLLFDAKKNATGDNLDSRRQNPLSIAMRRKWAQSNIAPVLEPYFSIP
jgi:hypothetical protein